MIENKISVMKELQGFFCMYLIIFMTCIFQRKKNQHFWWDQSSKLYVLLNNLPAKAQKWLQAANLITNR